MITLRTFSTRAEAEAVKGFLDANGISSLIQADDQGGMQPALSWIQGVQLKVNEVDAAKAEELLSTAPPNES